MKTVLMVDDDRSWCFDVRDKVRALDGKVLFLSVFSLEGAREMFQRYKYSLSVIVMDGQIDDTVEQTCQFVRELRESGFEAPIIAASSDYNYRLMSAGCSISGNKNTSDDLVADILKALAHT